MGHPLRITLYRDRGIAVLHLAGDLDLASAPLLRDDGRDLIDETFDATVNPAHPPPHSATAGDPPGPAAVVIDATEVGFIDSAGLGALVDLLKCVRRHRAGFSIAGADPLLVELLTRTGLVQVIALHPTAIDAVDAATGTRRPPPEGARRSAKRVSPASPSISTQ